MSKAKKLIIEEGYHRGNLTIHVAQDVPFYYAIKLLKDFDASLNPLYIGNIKNNYYQVEMLEQEIFITKKTDFVETGEDLH